MQSCLEPSRRAQRDRLRFFALIGLSVVLHALAFFWLARLEPQAPQKKRINLELAWVEVTPPPTPMQERPLALALPQQLSKEPKKKISAEVPKTGPAVQGTAAEPSPELGYSGDFPVANRPNLTPSSHFAMQLGTGGREELSRGSTVRNGPGEAPDQRALDEYTGEVLTRKLNNELQQEVGLAAVGVGNVPTHFKRYESAMRSMLPKANIDRTPMTDGDLARDIAGIMFNDGPSAEASRKVADSPLGRSVANQNVMTPNVADQRFRESAMQAMAQTENLKERITRARLRTVLEVTTDASGALADVSIVERSGDPRFDESVLHFSRKVARTIPDADDKLLGSSMWRTRWQFTWEPPDVRVRMINTWRVSGRPAAP